jgi:hypothetical protein
MELVSYIFNFVTYHTHKFQQLYVDVLNCHSKRGGGKFLDGLRDYKLLTKGCAKAETG